MSNTLLEDVLGVITPLEEDPWMRQGQMALNPGQQPTQMPNNIVGLFSHIPPEEQLPRLGAQLKSNIQGIPARLAEQNRKSHETFERVRAGGNLSDDIINEAIDWSPMGFGGVIRPTTWAAYTPEAKAAITGTANRHPELFKKVLEHPRDLLTTVETMEDMGNKLGAHQRTQFKNPRGEPINWMRIREDVKGREDVVPHELTHMLQNERVAQMDPVDAATIGKLMKDILPQDLQGSLRMTERRYRDVDPDRFGIHKVEGTPEDILKKIKEIDTSEKEILGSDWQLGKYIEPVHVTPGYNAYDDTSRQTHEVFGRMMADESFAHLAEALTGHHSSPELRKLANELGVFLDNPATGWKETMEGIWNRSLNNPQGWGSTAPPTGKLAEILKARGPSFEAEVWKVIRRMYDQAKRGPKGSGGTGMADVPPGRNPREAKLTPDEQEMWNKLSPEHRRSITPDFPRKPHNPESRRLFNQIMRKIAKETKGGGETGSTGMAIFRHGTDPQSAIGIIKEGLRPGSSISKPGGRDFEGYPVTFEFDDSLRGAKEYSSPFGPTAHPGAATTGTTAQNIKKVFFDPDEYRYKEDALDAFRQIRQALNESGRKDLRIEGAKYLDDLDKWEYGGKLSLKNLKSFTDHVRNASEPNLQRLFDETLDSIEAVPEARAEVLRKRLYAIIKELDRRSGGGETGSTGAIEPGTWNRYSPKAKASMTDIARQYPEKFKQILEDPQNLYYKVDSTGLSKNAVGRFRTAGLGGGTGTVQVRPGYEKGSSKTPVHELSHYLNRERVYNTDPDDAMTIGRLLQSIIPHGQRNSLDTVVRRATNPGEGILGSIAEIGGNFDHRTMKQGTWGLNTDKMMAMDEGFAHLAQAAAKPGASPELKKLARELGIDFTSK